MNEIDVALTDKISRPQYAGRLERRVRPSARNGAWQHRPRATKKRAVSPGRVRTRGPKDHKTMRQPPASQKAKPGATPNPQRKSACEGEWGLDIHGLERRD